MDDIRAAKRLLARHFSDRDRSRMEAFLEIGAGAPVGGSAAPHHEPTRLYFPGLTAKPWWDAEDFEWSADILHRTPAIVDEYAALAGNLSEFTPYEDSHTGDLGWPGWKTRHVYKGPGPADVAARAGPQTATAVQSTRRGPREGMFSVLTPGTHLKPHTGGVNLVLTVHVPLIIPDGDLGLRVADETRVWRPGELFIFDDSFIHEAWNFSSESRVVLLWDIWHPELTEDEVEMLGALITQTDLMERLI